MKHKSDFVLGLETILNNPQTNFMKNPTVFKEIHKASGMNMSDLIRHVGKKSKTTTKDEKPTDDDRSKERLSALEHSLTR
jgi:hypothetical protein